MLHAPLSQGALDMRNQGNNTPTKYRNSQNKQSNSVVLVRKRSIPTKRTPLLAKLVSKQPRFEKDMKKETPMT
jgi:hypothetical protein